ncbi:unnamed protein product [Rotaria sp. Silwood1]|nr:unnamed protein product [Rotaria sp. Silwood1]
MNVAEDEFCLIRWSDKNDFDIVPQRSIRAPSNTIETYETYQVEINGNQCEGTVIMKGTKRDCEKLQHNIALKSPNHAPAARSDTTPESNAEQFATASSSASRIPANMNEESNNLDQGISS